MGPQDLPVIAAVNEERWPGKWVFIWKYTAFLLYLSLKQLSITQVKVATTIIRLLWACSSWVAKRESLITYAAWFLEFMSVPPGAVKFSLPVIVYKNFTVPLNSYSSTGSHSLYFTVPTSSTGYSETAVLLSISRHLCGFIAKWIGHRNPDSNSASFACHEYAIPFK